MITEEIKRVGTEMGWIENERVGTKMKLVRMGLHSVISYFFKLLRVNWLI